MGGQEIVQITQVFFLSKKYLVYIFNKKLLITGFEQYYTHTQKYTNQNIFLKKNYVHIAGITIYLWTTLRTWTKNNNLRTVPHRQTHSLTNDLGQLNLVLCIDLVSSTEYRLNVQ